MNFPQQTVLFNLLYMYHVFLSFLFFPFMMILHCFLLSCLLELFPIHLVVFWVHYLIPGLKLLWIGYKNYFHRFIS